ncbi:MAG: methyltransferase domain-containing protein [Bacteroidia bacterium]|nr:methyltransferase domain-containing protein [Bacteroidia bacterium]
METAERVSMNEVADNYVFQRHLIAYQEAAKMIAGNIIELGSGSGYGAGVLMHSGITQYLAIDKFTTNFPEDIDKSRLTFRQMNLPFLKGIEDNQFDFAVSFQVIEHIEDDVTFLREIYRVLKPGGKLILTTPNKKMSLTRNPWHVREYTPMEMKKILESVFDKTTLNGIYGNETVMKYYDQNKTSVQRIVKWDILNLQYRLPRRLLQIPYDILNRLNRKRISDANNDLTAGIKSSDFFIAPVKEDCLDYFAICMKRQ